MNILTPGGSRCRMWRAVAELMDSWSHTGCVSSRRSSTLMLFREPLWGCARLSPTGWASGKSYTGSVCICGEHALAHYGFHGNRVTNKLLGTFAFVYIVSWDWNSLEVNGRQWRGGIKKSPWAGIECRSTFGHLDLHVWLMPPTPLHTSVIMTKHIPCASKQFWNCNQKDIIAFCWYNHIFKCFLNCYMLFWVISESPPIQ